MRKAGILKKELTPLLTAEHCIAVHKLQNVETLFALGLLFCKLQFNLHNEMSVNRCRSVPDFIKFWSKGSIHREKIIYASTYTYI